MLLHYSILTPHAHSGLAAVRFTAPVRIHSLRLFPTGARPFALCPDIIASTEPETFFLNVFFNAQAIGPEKDKQRSANALVPTVIAYAGGEADFSMDMGTEYATRLIILKGKFDKLSMAIYGELVTEHGPVKTYIPRPWPVMEHVPLSESMDPSHASDPTELSRKLLSIIPGSPPLSLVIRLMLCLKPKVEDWEDPEFPYLYLDLENDDGIYDLESIVQSMGRPARDDTSEDALAAFALRIADFVGPKSGDQSYQLAKILSQAASQHPAMAQTIMEQVDFQAIVDIETLDASIVSCLFDAAANADIARRMGKNDPFLITLQDAQNNSILDKQTRSAICRLMSRIQGWQKFESTLTDTQHDFQIAARFLKDIGSAENSLGTWLESMIIHNDLAEKVASVSLTFGHQSLPPCLIDDPTIVVTKEEFIVFLKAFMGVAGVLSVWAWADSVGNDACRERSLAIMSLWQGVNGYREILNHLLLLRQLVRRLQWIITDNDNDKPRRSGILAERVLSNLVADEHTILHADVAKSLLNLELPLSHITEQERLVLRKISLVAEDGLSAAVEEIHFISDRPLSFRRLRTLRISLAIIDRELLADSNGEWRILQALWDEQFHGLFNILVQVLNDVVGDLNEQFAVQSSRTIDHSLSSQLFKTADDLVRLLLHLSTGLPITSRTLRDMTCAVSDLFACAAVTETGFSVSSPVYISATNVRQTCLNLVHILSGPTILVEPSILGAEVVLRTLLQQGARSTGRDPVFHLLQIFSLIDHILPDASKSEEIGLQSHWIISVFPTILLEFRAFFRLLNVENQARIMRCIVKLDDNVTGIGEWLLIEQLKYLLEVLRQFTDDKIKISANDRLVYYHEIYTSISFLADILEPSTTVASWCIVKLSENPDLSRLLHLTLDSVLEGNYCSIVITKALHLLAQNANVFNMNIKFSILLCLLRIAHMDPTSPSALDFIVDLAKEIPPSAVLALPLRFEMGQLLANFADHIPSLPLDTSCDLLFLLEWLLSQDDSRLKILTGITCEAFTRVSDALSIALASLHNEDVIAYIFANMRVDEDEQFTNEVVELPEKLQLSIQDIETLIQPENLFIPLTPQKTKTPDIFGVVLSPPTALLRSPAATGLTKTYMNNDFRQLRQVPQARLNTSRMPSTHVDDFTNVSPPSSSVPNSFQSSVNP